MFYVLNKYNKEGRHSTAIARPYQSLPVSASHSTVLVKPCRFPDSQRHHLHNLFQLKLIISLRQKFRNILWLWLWLTLTLTCYHGVSSCLLLTEVWKRVAMWRGDNSSAEIVPFKTFKDFLFFVSDRLTKTPNKNLCALLQHNLPLKYFRSTWPKIFGSNFSFGDFSAKFFLFEEIHHLTIRLVDWKFWLVQNIIIILTQFLYNVNHYRTTRGGTSGELRERSQM